MKIYIPSRGRWNALLAGTLKYLEPSVRRAATIVVHESELSKYVSSIGDVVGEILPVMYDTIDKKRLLIGEHAKRNKNKKFMMLDDDLSFLTRKNDDSKSQQMSGSSEVSEALEYVERVLDDYASVGLSAREANGLSDCVIGPRPAIKENYRLMRAVGFRTVDFLSVEHCRVPCMEDHDVQLQLLKSGRPNAALYYWASGQNQTNQRGGCSVWRTLDVHNASARRLAELHPDVVHLRKKNNASSENGLGSRVECTISWKRAFKK